MLPPLPIAAAILLLVAGAPAQGLLADPGPRVVIVREGEPVAGAAVTIWRATDRQRWDGISDRNGHLPNEAPAGVLWARQGGFAALTRVGPARSGRARSGPARSGPARSGPAGAGWPHPTRTVELLRATAVTVRSGHLLRVRLASAPDRPAVRFAPARTDEVRLPPGRYSALVAANSGGAASGVMGETAFELGEAAAQTDLELPAPPAHTDGEVRIPTRLQPRVTLDDWPTVTLVRSEEDQQAHFRLPAPGDAPQRLRIRVVRGGTTAQLRHWRSAPGPLTLSEADFGTLRRIRVQTEPGAGEAIRDAQVRSQTTEARPRLLVQSGVDADGYAVALAMPETMVRVDCPGYAWATLTSTELDWQRGISLRRGRTLVLRVASTEPLGTIDEPVRIGLRSPGANATSPTDLRVGSVATLPAPLSPGTPRVLRFEHCPTGDLELFVTGPVADPGGRIPSGTANERIELELVPGRALRGRVTLPNGRAAGSAFVSVRDTARAESLRTAATRSDGSFVVHGLDPDALLTVRAEWRDGPTTYSARIRGVQAGTECRLQLTSEDPALPGPVRRDGPTRAGK